MFYTTLKKTGTLDKLNLRKMYFNMQKNLPVGKINPQAINSFLEKKKN